MSLLNTSSITCDWLLEWTRKYLTMPSWPGSSWRVWVRSPTCPPEGRMTGSWITRKNTVVSLKRMEMNWSGVWQFPGSKKTWLDFINARWVDLEYLMWILLTKYNLRELSMFFELHKPLWKENKFYLHSKYKI